MLGKIIVSQSRFVAEKNPSLAVGLLWNIPPDNLVDLKIHMSALEFITFWAKQKLGPLQVTLSVIPSIRFYREGFKVATCFETV